MLNKGENHFKKLGREDIEEPTEAPLKNNSKSIQSRWIAFIICRYKQSYCKYIQTIQYHLSHQTQIRHKLFGHFCGSKTYSQTHLFEWSKYVWEQK